MFLALIFAVSFIAESLLSDFIKYTPTFRSQVLLPMKVVRILVDSSSFFLLGATFC